VAKPGSISAIVNETAPIKMVNRASKALQCRENRYGGLARGKYTIDNPRFP
jgi:hypothetical protein